MMDGSQSPHEAAVVEAAEAYCRGIHTADVATLDRVFHDAFRMVGLVGDGAYQAWTKAQFLERVGGRDGFPGAPDFEILTVDVANDEMAWVKLAVAVPPRRFHDYLGLLKIDGAWRIVNKQFTVIDGPAL